MSVPIAIRAALPLWGLLWLTLLGRAQTVLPFFAPAQPAGSLAVKLFPMENVVPGVPTLVTFGVPFTRGSLTPAGLATVRVLAGGAEVPAHVELLTPWRHLSDPAVDGQSVRVARVQIRHTFAVASPEFETLAVEWGGPARTLDVPTLADPLTGWHPVTGGTFAAADGISEPDVYAVLPKAVLAQGVLSLRRTEPFADGITETRDDPAVTDATEHWPGYEEADRSFKNNFYTSINEDDPQVIEYDLGKLTDYRHDSEPWLYDRATTFFQLYVKTGFLRPLREAVRHTQFYRSRLYGAGVPDPYRGIFRLKAPELAQASGGNTTMYSYAECFAFDHWLTGDPSALEPVRWVAATHAGLTEPSRWTPLLGEWTERHTAFRTLANVVAFELTGEAAYRQHTLTQLGDFLWHQNGADGQLPADRLDGGLYHYGRQHGDGVFTDLIASPWMLVLVMDAVVRAYGVSEDPALAEFIIRAARFQALTTHYNDDHIYEYPGALRYPYYLARHDGTPDVRDGYDASAIEHAKEVVASIGWGAYFQHLRHGVPDPLLEARARELYLAFDIGVNHWTRPAAPPLGLTAFRTIPPRKFAWENRPSASLTWLMNQLDAVSPAPVVVITSPTANQRFTAPVNLLIEATAAAPNADIVKVEFFAGATKLGEDTTAPYTFQWDGVIAALPGHVLTAKATTTLGVVGNSEAVPLDVRSPTHPQLTITSPLPGTRFTAPADVTITADAVPEGASSISRVVITQNYQPVFEDTVPPYAHTLTGLLEGTHDYEVWAWDSNGGYTVQTLSITVATPTPPAVTLTAPVAGARTANGATLRLAATASAPGSAVTRVVFLADGFPVGEDTAAPYEFDWAVSTRWLAGAHTITARAHETLGGTATDSAVIELVSLPPMNVAWVSPAEIATFPFPAEIAMEASAAAPDSSIARVEFFANGQPVGIDTEAPFTASFTPDSIRQWQLVARAVDALGRTAEIQRTVHVTGPATPQVTLTAPAGGTVRVGPAVVTLAADASVTASTIVRVRFYDGATLLGEATTAPFTIDSPPLALGDHNLFAVATAATGREGTSPGVIITVGAANSPVAVVTAPRYEGPQFGASFGTVRFAAGAEHTGGLGLARVEFWLDNAFVGQDLTAPYEFDWVVGNRTGYHELVARAVDVNGATADSTRVAFELIVPPSVALTSPAPGAILNPGVETTLVATTVRGTYALDEVRFFVDGELVGTDTTAPFAVPWTPPAEGNYVLTARLRDIRFVDVWAPEVVVTGAANVAPLAVGDVLNRASNTDTAKVLVTSLLANDTDADGDALELVAVGNPQPAGATVSRLGNWVIYTSPGPLAGNGSFDYGLSDGPGGHTVVGTVTVVQVAPGTGGGPNVATISVNGGDFLLTFLGVPGQVYRVQYAAGPSAAPSWREFNPPAVHTAAPNGVFVHRDVAPAETTCLYRAVSHEP